MLCIFFFFFQAEDGIRDRTVTGVQTCALPILTSCLLADKKISVNKQDVTINELETRLRNIYDQRKDKTMFLIAAGTLRYRDIIEVIDAAKGAGVEKVGIVTEGMRKAAGAGGN